MYQVAHFVHLLFQALNIALFIRIALSWFPHDKDQAILSFIYQITDPILEPFQKLMPSPAGIDFSPILAFFALSFAERITMQLLL